MFPPASPAPPLIERPDGDTKAAQNSSEFEQESTQHLRVIFLSKISSNSILLLLFIIVTEVTNLI